MAGKKEEDEDHNLQFTGVMMGDLQADTNNAIPLTGLYGFRQGNPSFGFKEDGTAFIGEAGLGRILFEGNKGWIASGDLIEKQQNNNTFYKVTSLIDLTSQGVPIQTYKLFSDAPAVPLIIDQESEEEELEEIEEIEETTGLDNIILASENLIVKFGNNFFISSDGNVSVRGDLTASRLVAIKTGAIAGFNFTNTWLYNSNYSSSILVGPNGIYLGGRIDVNQEDGSILKIGSVFSVNAAGYLKSRRGSLAGWHFANNIMWYIPGYEEDLFNPEADPTDEEADVEDPNEDDEMGGSSSGAISNSNSFYLNTNGENNLAAVKFGNNFYITKDGVVNLNSVLVNGTLQVNGYINNFFRLETKKKAYTLTTYKGIKVAINCSVSGYRPISIAKITTGHAHVLKITSYKFLYETNKWYAYVYLSHHPLKTSISGTLYATILYMRSSSGENLQEQVDIDDLTPEQIAEIQQDEQNANTENGTATTDASPTAEDSGFYITAGDSSLEGANSTLYSILTNYVTTSTNQNISGTKNFTGTLQYNGINVATTSYVGNIFGDSGTGATNEWVKGRFYSTNSSDSHYLNISLYAKIASPTFTGVPKTQEPQSSNSNRPGQVNTTQIPTCSWVYDNYCEIKGETISSIKDKINDIIDAANLNISKFST